MIKATEDFASKLKPLLLSFGANAQNLDGIEAEMKSNLHDISVSLKKYSDYSTVENYLSEVREKTEKTAFSIIFGIAATLSLIKHEEGADEYNRVLIHYIMAYLILLDELWNGEENGKN